MQTLGTKVRSRVGVTVMQNQAKESEKELGALILPTPQHATVQS